MTSRVTVTAFSQDLLIDIFWIIFSTFFVVVSHEAGTVSNVLGTLIGTSGHRLPTLLPTYHLLLHLTAQQKEQGRDKGRLTWFTAHCGTTTIRQADLIKGG